MQNETTGELAFSIHKQIASNERERRRLLADNMRLIHQMHHTDLYKTVLGDERAPWSAYLSQFDVFYTQSKVYTMDKIYETFVKKLGIAIESIFDIPSSKLGVMIPVITRDNVNEWLTKARELTSQDFNDEVRVAQGKVSYLNCEHKDTSEYVQCKACGHKHSKDEH